MQFSAVHIVVIVLDLALLVLFFFSFGATLWTSSLSGILSNLVAWIASLCVVATLTLTAYALKPCCMAEKVNEGLMSLAAANALWSLYVCFDGDAAMVCDGVDFLSSVCSGDAMEYVYWALYLTSWLLQLAFLFIEGHAGSLSSSDSLGVIGSRRRDRKSQRRAERLSGAVWASGSEEEAGVGLAQRERRKGAAGGGGGEGGEWSEGSERSDSGEEGRERGYDTGRRGGAGGGGGQRGARKVAVSAHTDSEEEQEQERQRKAAKKSGGSRQGSGIQYSGVAGGQ